MDPENDKTIYFAADYGANYLPLGLFVKWSLTDNLLDHNDMSSVTSDNNKVYNTN